MYRISDEVLNLFRANYLQTAIITVNTSDGSFELTEADIVQGGLTIDRRSCGGSKLEIGTAIASELTLTLDNHDGRFDEVRFEGAELYVRIGIKKWDAHRWENAQLHVLPMGYFTVDEPPRKLDRITLSALDRMVHFDKTVDFSLLTFSMTVSQLLDRICVICNIQPGFDPGDLPNATYIITVTPEEDGATYRDILSWICEICGSCAYIDENGRLMIGWYSKTGAEITPSERYDHDIYENPLTITGVAVADQDTDYLAGTDDYAIYISDNPLIQHDHANLAAALYNRLGGFTYTPFSAEIKSDPRFWPLDVVDFIDKAGQKRPVAITDTAFTLNMNTFIAGKGETAAKNGYAALNPLTKSERRVIDKLRREQNKQLDDREQAALNLNETIWNSMGLRRTDVTAADGSVIHYYHDGDTLESSTIIYTFRAGGFAWTDEWNGDDTVWQYGLTRDGNALLNILTAYKIRTEQIDAEAITAEKLSVEYRRSVEDAINSGLAEVEQKFIAADGELKSSISEQISETETTLRSEILQTASDIELSVGAEIDEKVGAVSDEVTSERERAEGAEDELRSVTERHTSKLVEIDLSLDGITQTVSTQTEIIDEQGKRLETAESKIEQTDRKIESKVSVGDVCAAIKQEVTEDGADVEITGNHFIVDSDNFKLNKNGEASVSGSFSSKSGIYETRASGGKIDLLYNGVSALTVAGGDPSYNMGPAFFALNSSNIVFLVGGQSGRIITMSMGGGLSCGNLTADSANINGSIALSGYMQNWYMSVPMYFSNGGLRIDGGVTVNGPLMCLDSNLKLKAVKTEHFGYRGLAAMESALPVFSDMGSGVCDESGIGHIEIDPVFAETVDEKYDYYVFLTQTGEKKVEYVAEKSETYFTVKGEAGACFDWIIYAPQKNLSGSRLEEIDVPPQKYEYDFDASIFDGENVPASICEEYMNEFITEAERLSAGIV